MKFPPGNSYFVQWSSHLDNFGGNVICFLFAGYPTSVISGRLSPIQNSCICHALLNHGSNFEIRKMFLIFRRITQQVKTLEAFSMFDQTVKQTRSFFNFARNSRVNATIATTAREAYARTPPSPPPRAKGHSPPPPQGTTPPPGAGSCPITCPGVALSRSLTLALMYRGSVGVRSCW